MAEKYAILKLYYGLCQSDGLGEGRFFPAKKDEWSKARFTRALERMQYYLSPDRKWGLRAGGYYEDIVHNEEEAENLIEFAEKNIRGASGIIEPVSSGDGEIAFWRKIRFNSWVAEQKEELIWELKKSNYIPRYDKKDDLEGQIKTYKEANSDKECDKAWIQVLEKELGKLDPDTPWRRALNFF